jgi:oxepin-CoA hydrolase/3-oxo-5,6-dehydrosuberyl-CoA semialdehyde dehydrogenase
VEESVPFNLEADSLNACVLGEDSTPGTPEFDLFIKEVQKEITGKTGQKCPAVRRIVVPEKLVEDVQIALGKRLEKTIIGDPSVEGEIAGWLSVQMVENGMKLSEGMTISVPDQGEVSINANNLIYAAPMLDFIPGNIDNFNF